MCPLVVVEEVAHRVDIDQQENFVKGNDCKIADGMYNVSLPQTSWFSLNILYGD